MSALTPHDETAAIDGAFRALADPTRRGVIERLARGPAPVSELAAPFDMALPSFMQHLKVLERGGLVSSEKKGRVRTYRLSPQPLQQVAGWLRNQEALWERRLDQLDAFLLQRKDTER